MPEIKRPLSPHLGIYEWRVSNSLSILHRMTGVALSAGVLVLLAWIISAALGEATYNCVLGLLSGPLGILVLFSFSASFFYHFANGIRHLGWDIGCGLGKETARLSGWFVLGASIGCTLLFWLGVMS
ncbi:MAG: succinate dehydrogenase, cytochrome b556 subunit [Gammaproteobacteria bacterium]|nr:succinate dehydrogenase, cytochrome b556 subunit [Gammaproteobacteria bacterium]MCP4088808.1 succinate dehydrogenase, cytochrome b556 subunit [Gammaproteobacteria bacterium]MCP4275893.1 succinate dehydrogenase, cytochrome b556 subunit [Gammaproteobacteria bacterium]MCP4832109.1 succinate dehydrogenase, cytochrome b556 subunit [Gammaproteobacteria bacterium]MCP4928290.1 succinate dehydrogenase, cytochrome b556 subunit [Gammaproteobacteria bacterium]